MKLNLSIDIARRFESPCAAIAANGIAVQPKDKTRHERSEFIPKRWQNHRLGLTI